MQDKPALTAGQLRDMLAYLPYDSPILIALSRERVVGLDVEPIKERTSWLRCDCSNGDEDGEGVEYCEKCDPEKPDTEIFLRTQ